MNKVELSGRPTGDPEVRYTAGDNSMAIARVTLAVNRRRSKGTEGEQEADFIRLVAFGREAEFMERYIKKGIKILVVGRIQTGSYLNKDGVRVYTTEVVVEDIEFAESKKSDSSQQQGTSSAGDGFMNIPDGIDEEFPFP